jgi:hypothetical protein
MKKQNDISYRLIAISLIVVVGIHSLNSFFNTHSHRLPDGTVITHAHPYDHSSDTNPFKSHKHTATELVFLASMIHFLPAIAFLLIGLVVVCGKRTNHIFQLLPRQFFVGIPSLRGPPALAVLG